MVTNEICVCPESGTEQQERLPIGGTPTMASVPVPPAVGLMGGRGRARGFCMCQIRWITQISKDPTESMQNIFSLCG